MTSSVCDLTAEGEEKQLKDTRDGQLYWVGKMKDGRCWMLQNLALDITESGLKASDTDITEDWNSSSAYPPKATSNNASTATTTATDTRSWDFDKVVLATPFLYAICSNNSANGGTVANCTSKGFVDVSSSSFQPTYTAETGNWEGANATNNTLVTVNCIAWEGTGTSKICTAGTYDAHYLVGNYYQWNAATAGTGGAIININVASGSICPKGWKLPTGGASGGQQTLISAYGIFNLTGTVDGVSYNAAGSPLRLVRSGEIYDASYVGGPARNGTWWSSTGYNGGRAYNLYIDINSVSTTFGANEKGRAKSVRCVAEYAYDSGNIELH